MAARRADPNYQTWGNRMTAKYPGIYSALASHKNVCTNPNAHAYKDYGGRGIEYRFDGTLEAACQALLAQLGPRPEGHTLDRIDVDGHVELDNLRWATPTQQSNNRRIRPTAAEWVAVCTQFPEAKDFLASLRT